MYEIRSIEHKYGNKWNLWGEKNKYDNMHSHMLVYSGSTVGNHVHTSVLSHMWVYAL